MRPYYGRVELVHLFQNLCMYHRMKGENETIRPNLEEIRNQQTTKKLKEISWWGIVWGENLKKKLNKYNYLGSLILLFLIYLFINYNEFVHVLIWVGIYFDQVNWTNVQWLVKLKSMRNIAWWNCQMIEFLILSD